MKPKPPLLTWKVILPDGRCYTVPAPTADEARAFVKRGLELVWKRARLPAGSVVKKVR